MDKTLYLSQLYINSCKEITGSKENYLKLLDCVSRFYKYSFDNNVLIYLQRPNAVMLAEHNIWFNKLKRYINKGTKGLAVLDMSNPKATLKFLFEISDTNGSAESYNQAINSVWQLEEQYYKRLNEIFSEKFSIKSNSIDDCIIKAIDIIVEKRIRNIVNDLKITDKESILYNVPLEAVKEEYLKLIKDSIKYVVFKRSGLNIENNNLQFENLNNYGTLNLFRTMGNITMNTSRNMLADISKGINQIKEERIRNEAGEKNIPALFISENNNIPINNSLDDYKGDTGYTIDEETELKQERETAQEYKQKEIEITDNVNSADFLQQQENHNINNQIEDSDETNKKNDNETGYTNYVFSREHNLYNYGAKGKTQNNISAIKILKKLESENRQANEKEQIILARYVGWGGLANALTENKEGWIKEYEEIKSILTEEEFASAVSSTLTAYYTDQKLIEYIFKALDNFGFKSGKILDPAMGTGNFFSVIPDSMKSSKLYGIELDSITGRIAKQLYPNANIQIKGFEDTMFENNTFDVSIGNIPFNRLQVNDLEYNKYKLFIHEYFAAKMIDKTRSGGITAIISSKGLMDRNNINARKYIAQRAELIGAIRLPNNAFKQIAGTEVTADILFFQKREKEIVPDVNNTNWLTIEKNENEIPINSYFINNPEMILGEMVFDNSMYANETTTACKPFEDKDFYVLLDNAINSLKAEYKETVDLKQNKEKFEKVIPADPNVKNYSYTEVNGDIYYRENSIMSLCSFDGIKKERVKGLIAINNVLKDIISFQSEPYNMVKYQGNEYEKEFNKKLNLLNKVYDSFVSKYGFINDKYNCSLFRQDSSMPLLRSIEQETGGYTKNNKKIYKKEAVFYKPTIRPFVTPKSALSAEEALKISLNIKGNLDLDYMSELYKKSKDEIISELDGQIYQNPEKYNNKPYEGWETADEYLSGYVKDKLFMAKMAAEENPELFSKNVEALEKVQPVSVKAGEIGFELGSEWIPVEYYNTFMKELFDSPYYIKINYSQFTNTYYISDKKHDNSLIVINRYGTKDKNAYEILECSLNKKPADVREKKKYIDKNGEVKERYVIKKDKTIEVREKQAQIQLEFENWLFRDEVRTAEIVKLYNDLYNNLVPRTYNGDFLTLPDMNSEIALRDYQKEAIAQALYSNKNELIAHEVGLGKTYTAITICHEAKRLGLFSKPLIAVPNGIVEQWAAAYMKLYPTADILVVTKKDFEKNNRKRFVSRIAMTNFEAVIIAHSTFELIKISAERQKEVIKKDIDLITEYIKEEKMKDNKSWTLKQMQIAKKNLEYRYERLMNEEKKDDVINFDELGIDMLIVDEAHLYKNLYNVTKLRNVAGINTSNSQRAMDMYLKCQLLNKRNGDKGIIYLTGTPVSNSMSEIFIMQKTLQPSILERNRLINFDAWASMYGKITSSMELKPEGSGYQMKTRFSKFRNLPELMNMFRQIANIKTAEIADIPRPEIYTGKREVIKLPITPNQKRKMIEFAERAELIRLGNVESWEDNFLKLTHEAKLNAIDPKILDNSLERDFNTKLYKCAEKVAEIYNETSTEKLTQIIFCDSGTPKGNDEYSFYSEIKNTLKKLNVNEKEIAFIHDYNTDKQKEDLYSKVRNGEIRILIGSTAKMGVGVNIQDRLIALHHLDIPWRPSDLIQREGRILRFGNMNPFVHIFIYITEDTFDAYMYQILENKQRYISQIMTSSIPVRDCEDIDETTLEYAEFKAMAVSNPKIKEKMEVDNEVGTLKILKSRWQSNQYELLEKVNKKYPNRIKTLKKEIESLNEDRKTVDEHIKSNFEMEIQNKIYTDKTEAGEHLQNIINKNKDIESFGKYYGLDLSIISGNGAMAFSNIVIKGKGSYSIHTGDSGIGNITRIKNRIDDFNLDLLAKTRELKDIEKQTEIAKEELQKPFEKEEQLGELLQRQTKLSIELQFNNVNLIIDDTVTNIENEEIEENTVDIVENDTEEESEDKDIDEYNEDEADMNRDSIEDYLNEKNISMAKKNYEQLYNFNSDILTGESYYMKFKSHGFDDLVIKDIGYNEISVAHYYEQNGDLMADPDITFKKDDKNKMLIPTSYTQHNMGIYYETINYPDRITGLQEFICQWFENIKEQGYELYDERYNNGEQYINKELETDFFVENTEESNTEKNVIDEKITSELEKIEKYLSEDNIKLAEDNYKQIYNIAKDILTTKSYLMQFKNESEYLFFGKIENGKFSISHYNNIYGNLIENNNIDVLIDNENKMLIPELYNGKQIFETDINCSEKLYGLQQLISKWFDDIEANKYEISSTSMYDEGDIDEEIKDLDR